MPYFSPDMAPLQMSTRVTRKSPQLRATTIQSHLFHGSRKASNHNNVSDEFPGMRIPDRPPPDEDCQSAEARSERQDPPDRP